MRGGAAALVEDALVLVEGVALVPEVRGGVGALDDVGVVLEAALEVTDAGLPVAQEEVEGEAVAARGPAGLGGVAEPAGALEGRVEGGREGVRHVGRQRAEALLGERLGDAWRGAAAAGLRVAQRAEGGERARLLRCAEGVSSELSVTLELSRGGAERLFCAMAALAIYP